MQYFIIFLMAMAVLSIVGNLIFLSSDKLEWTVTKSRPTAIVTICIACAYMVAYYQLYQMITS